MSNIRGFMENDRASRKRRDPLERLRDYKEHYLPMPEVKIRQQAGRCMDCGTPFCMSGCPLGNIIPDWNDFIYQNEWREALKVLLDTNNFPEFTGRICPAPCEGSCVLGINEPPVTIKLHEVEIIDRGFQEGWIKPQPPERRTGKTVAVIGGGPAGLATAELLNRAGHVVTIFEKDDRMGGLLMYGIPEYKLPKAIVQRRVDLLLQEGVTFKFGCHVGVNVDIKRVRADYDALVIAIGAGRPRDLPVEGRNLEGVHFAMEYLPQQNRRNLGDADPAFLHPEKKPISAEGKDVIVIGGGDTGSDCIGNALRQHAKSVTNFELLSKPPDKRPPDNPWPDWPHIYRVSTSMEELFATGGQVEYGVTTKRFIGENGKLTGIETVQVEWQKDASGKTTMREIAGSEKIYPAQLALLAMGYLGPVQTLAQELCLEVDARSNIQTDVNKMTSVPGVFAAGDCRRGQSLVVWAIAEGRAVARAVDEHLMAESALPVVLV